MIRFISINRDNFIKRKHLAYRKIRNIVVGISVVACETVSGGVVTGRDSWTVTGRDSWAVTGSST